MPRRALWACSKYAPWLGVLTCAQWDLLQRRRSAVTAHRRRTWSRRERCSRRRRSHGVHGCADASLPRPHGVSTVLVPRLHWVLLFPLRSHRNCKELPRQPLRYRGAPTASIDVCHWVVSKLGLERIHQVTNTIRIANIGWRIRICIREYTFFSEAINFIRQCSKFHTVIMLSNFINLTIIEMNEFTMFYQHQLWQFIYWTLIY